MSVIVRLRPFSGYFVNLSSRIFRIYRRTNILKITKKIQKILILVGIRKIDFDDQDASKLAAMIF